MIPHPCQEDQVFTWFAEGLRFTWLKECLVNWFDTSGNTLQKKIVRVTYSISYHAGQDILHVRERREKVHVCEEGGSILLFEKRNGGHNACRRSEKNLLQVGKDEVVSRPAGRRQKPYRQGEGDKSQCPKGGGALDQGFHTVELLALRYNIYRTYSTSAIQVPCTRTQDRRCPSSISLRRRRSF